MQMRALGKTGLSIAPIVFGGNVFGWTVDEKTSFNILDAFDAGFNALDTADVYSAWVPGKQGRQIGRDHRQVAQEGCGFPRQGTVCTDTGAKPAQIALAWLMQKKGVTAPIASDQPLPA